eukprot:665311-Prymnesium_polylepis.1
MGRPDWFWTWGAAPSSNPMSFSKDRSGSCEVVRTLKVINFVRITHRTRRDEPNTDASAEIFTPSEHSTLDVSRSDPNRPLTYRSPCLRSADGSELHLQRGRRSFEGGYHIGVEVVAIETVRDRNDCQAKRCSRDGRG